VFVATGTGVAPFLPMFNEMAGADELGSSELYFGCRTAADDITRALARCRLAQRFAPAATTPPTPLSMDG
jgi:ferredoxin-NADP reductase